MNPDNELLSLEESEYGLLLRVGALVSSANNFALLTGGGFRIDNKALTLDWSSQAINAIGLIPSESKVDLKYDCLTRILFAPDEESSPCSYWSTLFGNEMPGLVMEYEIADGENTTVDHTHETWFNWPWHMDYVSRLNSIETALAAQAELEDRIGQHSSSENAMDGSSAELFEGVASYFESLNVAT